MISQYKLSDYDAGVLVNDREKADFYEEAMKTARDAKKMANWVIGDISAWLNKNSVALAQSKLTPEAAAELVNVIHDGVISGKQGKEIFEEVMQGKMPREVIKEKGWNRSVMILLFLKWSTACWMPIHSRLKTTRMVRTAQSDSWLVRS